MSERTASPLARFTFGVMTRASGNSSDLYVSTASGSSNVAPLSATITGSTTTGTPR